MGYPMTFKRVIGRNRLDDESEWHAGPGAVAWSLIEGYPADQLIAIWKRQLEHQATSCDAFNGKVRMLRDDMRRLVLDAQDEQSTCQYIASRTGVDPEVVAAVLKEFMSW